MRALKCVSLTLFDAYCDVSLPPGSLSASSIGSGVGNHTGNSGSNKNGTRNSPVPTVECIKQLGRNNVFWTSQQLDLMALEDFRATVETFGGIPDLDLEQLERLKAKAVEVIMSTLLIQEVEDLWLG